MKIALPMANELLCMHFGHCEQFALIDVNPTTKTIIKRENVTPPPHEPGLLPPWLAQQGVNAIIAGGMGQRALQLFTQNGIQVVVGAPAEEPGKLVELYLTGQLTSGDNVCDH
jgi:predicted Fe-Mo cluster-binding NifX family protein